MKRKLYYIKWGIIKSIVVLTVMFSLIGCTKMLYVPVESVKTEFRDVLKRDSIFLYDSIYVKEKGDTVLVERFRYLYRDVLRVDSFIRTDSIKVPFPVEKQLSRWERTKMDVGGWAIGVLSGVFLLGITYIVIRLVGKKRKV